MVDHGIRQVTHLSNSSDDQTGKQDTSNGQVQDVEIAGSVAKAALTVPEVASLSPGHSALAATYGPTQRVTGVVVRRSAPDDMSLEVHVVLRVASTAVAARALSREVTSSEAGEGSLPAMAAQVREAVFRAIGEMGLPPPVEVDVFIDDIIWDDII
jgi:hypothetical protein